jgi:hypothetical protein
VWLIFESSFDMLRFFGFLALGCVVFFGFQDSTHGCQSVRAVEPPDRLLPKETILLFESDSIGKVLDKFRVLAEKTGIGPRSVTIKPTPGTRPRYAFGIRDPNAPPPELAPWPPQWHGPDADSFRLGPQFFEVFSKIAGTDVAFDFRRLCTEVLLGPGFIAVVKVSDDRYGLVFRVKVDQESTLPKLLSSEKNRLGGQRVTADGLEEGIHWIDEAGIGWFVEDGFLYVTDVLSLAQVLFERIRNPAPTDDCLAKERLYQRLMLSAKRAASEFSIYSNSRAIAACRNAWWERVYPPTDYEWVPGRLHDITMLGSIVFGNLGRPEDSFLDLSVVRVYEYPFDDSLGFLRDVTPIRFAAPLRFPSDVTGVDVFGGNGIGEMSATLFPGRSEWLPTCGAFFYRRVEHKYSYSGFLWDDLPDDDEFQDFHTIRPFTTHGRETTDSDLEYEKQKTENPSTLEPNTSLLRFNDRWYYLGGDYLIRKQLRKSILGEQGMAASVGSLDVEYINRVIQESSEKNLVFVEARQMDVAHNIFPSIIMTGDLEAFFGFPPCNRLYQPLRLATQLQRVVSDVPATKDELLVSQKADRIDWLSDFWFRLRFALYTHMSDFRFSNPPVVYSFHYLDRPAGILRTEIRVVLTERNK